VTYEVLILRRAQRELAGLPRDAYESAREAIRALGTEPRPRAGQRLTGRPGWRIRVGDYRIIYEIDDPQQQVTVIHIGHRRDVYR